jgi:hypothetical protein
MHLFLVRIASNSIAKPKLVSNQLEIQLMICLNNFSSEKSCFFQSDLNMSIQPINDLIELLPYYQIFRAWI